MGFPRPAFVAALNPTYKHSVEKKRFIATKWGGVTSPWKRAPGSI